MEINRAAIDINSLCIKEYNTNTLKYLSQNKDDGQSKYKCKDDL